MGSGKPRSLSSDGARRRSVDGFRNDSYLTTTTGVPTPTRA